MSRFHVRRVTADVESLTLAYSGRENPELDSMISELAFEYGGEVMGWSQRNGDKFTRVDIPSWLVEDFVEVIGDESHGDVDVVASPTVH